MSRSIAVLCCLALLSAPALAQTSASPDEQPADIIMAGVGVGVVPAYEGSTQSRAVPVPGVMGRISGYKFFMLGNVGSLDLIRDRSGPGWDFQLGPAASLGFNRTSLKSIDDVRIRALGKHKLAIELGGYAGIARQGVITSDYDRLSLSVTLRHDVNGGHGGTIVSPSLTYMTPLSEKAMVTAFASASHVDDHYANAYYTITPAQSLASGLPAYQAHDGWSSVTVGAGGMVSLTGDLTHGLMLAAGAAYGRMQGNFADSPVVSIAGSRKQWMAGIGLAYSF